MKSNSDKAKKDKAAQAERDGWIVVVLGLLSVGALAAINTRETSWGGMWAVTKETTK